MILEFLSQLVNLETGLLAIETMVSFADA